MKEISQAVLSSVLKYISPLCRVCAESFAQQVANKKLCFNLGHSESKHLA